MGWTMNDLRSRSRSLAAVPDEGSVPTSTPPRDRRESEEQAGRRMSRRQSIAERAKRAAADGQPIEEQMPLPVSEDDSKFASSRPATERVSAEAAKQELTEQEQAESEIAASSDVAANGSRPGKKGSKGPSSRPNRRREVADEESEENEDRFPWHFQFDDDEPEELQASSPLLSRAFRATTG